MKGVLVTAVVCLAAGLFVIFYFCNGTTGLSFAYPLSGCSIHIDITTTGAGVPVAVGLVATGAFLLMIATVIALIGMFRRERDIPPTRHRESAFEE
ncbi:MAG TPA: hypothetical protein VK574_18455 [Terracidiphilus sp.]|nr:hypothetical protein [Terracidiphilus sp.]